MVGAGGGASFSRSSVAQRSARRVGSALLIMICCHAAPDSEDGMGAATHFNFALKGDEMYKAGVIRIYKKNVIISAVSYLIVNN